MKYWIPILCTVCLVVTGCNLAHVSNESRSSKSLREAVFLSELDNCTALWDLEDYGWPFAPWGKDEAWLAALTKPQRMQLGGWFNSEGRRVTLMTTLNHFRKFQAENGRTPESGFELAEFIVAKSIYQMEEVLGMSQSGQLTVLGAFVNPVSGRLYKSFDGEILEAGSVRFRELTEYDEVVAAFGPKPGATRFLDPGVTSAWEITVFLDPNTILDKHVVIAYAQEPPDNGTTIIHPVSDPKIRKAIEARGFDPENPPSDMLLLSEDELREALKPDGR